MFWIGQTQASIPILQQDLHYIHHIVTIRMCLSNLNINCIRFTPFGCLLSKQWSHNLRSTPCFYKHSDYLWVESPNKVHVIFLTYDYLQSVINLIIISIAQVVGWHLLHIFVDYAPLLQGHQFGLHLCVLTC